MIALHQNTGQPWGTSVSSQNSSDFAFQWVDTQNSARSKQEKLLFSGKRVISLLDESREKDSSMLLGIREAEGPELMQGNSTNEINLSGFSLRMSLHGKSAPMSA